ncbi:PKD domain-containing protein [Pseudoalteromonas sp. T1lg65]|uniref:PKD domain-containing protein n=1 Tax=Pseudoalteromonas sp. T1lg65 TaxID=2077101 RepID=UPI003F797C03
MNKSLITSILCCSLLLVGCGGSSNKSSSDKPVDTSPGGGGTTGGGSTSTQPVAKIQSSASGVAGDTLQVSAAGSTIPANAKLSWRWQSKPDGSTAQFADTTAQQTHFTADVAGTYIIELLIESNGKTAKSQFTITVRDKVDSVTPVAKIQSTAQGYVGDTLQVSAAGSTIPANAKLSWRWQTKPNGSTAKFGDEHAQQTYFTADVAGTYIVELTITSGENEAKAQFSITIKDKAATIIPIAKIQSSVLGYTGDTLQVSAVSSTIPANAQLAWSWAAKPTGSTAQFADPNATLTQFTADVAGTYIVKLFIRSGANEATAQFTITIKDKTPPTENTPPVASFTLTKQEIAVNEYLKLDGRASSDKDNDNLSYQWQVKAPENVPEYILVSPKNSVASFASRFPGEYTITLTVTDGKASHSQSANITVAGEPPATAKPLNAVITAPTEVTLSGLITLVTLNSTDKSQFYGSVLPLWSIDSKPEDSNPVILGVNGFDTSMTVDKPGQYQIRLSFKDRNGKLSEDTHTFTAQYGDPSRPLVYLDRPESGRVNHTVEISAKRSRDLDGRPLTFKWTFEPKTADMAYSVEDENTHTVKFTPHSEGFYKYQVEVSNGELSDIAPGHLYVDPENYAPRIEISPKTTVASEGETKTFYVTGSDKDGDTLTYTWSLYAKPDNSQAVINDTGDQAAITFDVAGSYIVKCVASDGELEAWTVAAVKVSEAQNSTPSITSIGYQGTPSRNSLLQLTSTVVDQDSESSDLTYFWKVFSPTGQVITDTIQQGVGLQFTPTDTGNYHVELNVVDDKSGAVATKAFSLTVE